MSIAGVDVGDMLCGGAPGYFNITWDTVKDIHVNGEAVSSPVAPSPPFPPPNPGAEQQHGHHTSSSSDSLGIVQLLGA